MRKTFAWVWLNVQPTFFTQAWGVSQDGPKYTTVYDVGEQECQKLLLFADYADYADF